VYVNGLTVLAVLTDVIEAPAAQDPAAVFTAVTDGTVHVPGMVTAVRGKQVVAPAGQQDA